MSRFALFLLLLVGGPAFAINDAQLDAVIKECKQGPVCPCPPAKIANIDKSACGPEPKDYVDAQGNWHGKALEKYNKCLSEVIDENIKINAYNNIFANCQRPHASDEKTKFTNLPPRPIYPGEGKTLNEQVQDVKAAERAEEDRAYAAAHRSVQPAQQSQPQPSSRGSSSPPSRTYIGARNGRMVECILNDGNFHDGVPGVLCLAETWFPDGDHGGPCTGDDIVNGQKAFVCAGGDDEHAQRYLGLKQRFTSGTLF